MFCTQCGTQNPDITRFCSSCGQALQVPAHVSTAGIPPPLPSPAASRLSASQPISDGVKGWSWGAFFLNWIWAIGNRTWWGLLALIPYVGFGVAIWLGFKGREMAWKNRQWESLEQFNRVQKKWSQWGVGLVLAACVIGILAAIAIPAYHDYGQRSREVVGEDSNRVPASRAEREVEAEPQVSRSKSPSHGVITREEFQRLVEGHTADEVLRIVGKPDQTQDMAGTQIWYYEGRTKDPVTGNVDNMAQIMFEHSFVHMVSFM